MVQSAVGKWCYLTDISWRGGKVNQQDQQSYGEVFLHPEYCSWTSHLQGSMVSTCWRGAASSLWEWQRSRSICSCCVEGWHHRQSRTTGDIQSLLVFSPEEWQTCQVDGNRWRLALEGKGLVVPCVYIFRGKQKHLDRLISVFAKLEVPS